MSRLTRWVALTVVAVLGVLAAGWVLIVSPKRADAEQLHQAAAAQQAQNRQLATQLAVLKAQQRDLPAEQAKLAALGVQVPPTPEQAVLLRSLSAAADAAGVELVSVAPGALAAVSATPAAATAPATATATANATATATAGTTTAAVTTATSGSAAGTLMSMPVTLTVAGGYFEAEKYVAALEALPRVVRVTALTVTPGANPVVAGGATQSLEDGQHLLTTITAQVFVASGAQPLTPATTVTK